ncbi:MAG: substrate-binding domain-containing protein [Lachnospiraceae bacterium]
MKKKLLSALLCVAMVATMVVGCGSKEEDTTAKKEDKKEDSYKCGFVVGSFEHTFYQLIGEGIEAKAKEIGMEAIVTDAELDPNVATNKVQDLSAQGCEAIALSCNDAAGVKPAIENASKDGVAMFTFDCTSESDAINCFVGTDNVKGGTLGGQELIRLTKDGDKVAIIGYPTASSCLDRENGALEALKSAKREVISGNNYEGDANKAQEIMETILTANPDLAAVFCVGDPAATGALAAIKAAGTDTKIIGFDGNPEAKEAILDKEGNGKWWVSEISQDPKKIGSTIVEQMQKFLSTKKVDDKVIYIEPYIITEENAAE